MSFVEKHNPEFATYSEKFMEVVVSLPPDCFVVRYLLDLHIAGIKSASRQVITRDFDVNYYLYVMELHNVDVPFLIFFQIIIISTHICIFRSVEQKTYL